MRLIVDTHILLWALGDPARLPATATALMESAELFVSAASIWEISIKTALGKLEADPAEVRASLAEAGFDELPVLGIHAAAVRHLPEFHRDPFDRLLIAQAIMEPMRLLTNDRALRPYGDMIELV
jgi:PIN domain nuclease of toxin-antitoxin system